MATLLHVLDVVLIVMWCSMIPMAYVSFKSRPFAWAVMVVSAGFVVEHAISLGVF